jgi:hypothetical protein
MNKSRRDEIVVLKSRDANVTTMVRHVATNFDTLYFANASPYPNNVEYDVVVTEGSYEHEHASGFMLLNPVGISGDIRPVVTYNKKWKVVIRKLISHVKP